MERPCVGAPVNSLSNRKNIAQNRDPKSQIYLVHVGKHLRVPDV
jgi:hypothetical protein